MGDDGYDIIYSHRWYGIVLYEVVVSCDAVMDLSLEAVFEVLNV
jgi:hypothetical protein